MQWRWCVGVELVSTRCVRLYILYSYLFKLDAGPLSIHICSFVLGGIHRALGFNPIDYQSSNLLSLCFASTGIYRSAFPQRKNFSFLKKLKLKSILTLILEDYPRVNLEYVCLIRLSHSSVSFHGPFGAGNRVQDRLP